MTKDIEDNDLYEELQTLLNKNKEKRIIVVGTTCVGKTTLIKKFPEAVDMDEAIFPLLTKEEKDYVCQSPWTPEIGDTMTRLVKNKIVVKPGHPVFGTVVIDADLIIFLRISDELLKERVTKREGNFSDAKNMQVKIEQEITKSKVPAIRLFIT